MKKIVLATIAIWAAGIGSAAALVNTLAKPPVPVAQVEAPAPAPAPPPNVEHFKVPRPMALAPVVKAVRTQIRAPKRVKREMKCGEWKSLQIGPVDRGVRYCK